MAVVWQIAKSYFERIHSRFCQHCIHLGRICYSQPGLSDRKAEQACPLPNNTSLRVLSYNIQAGMKSKRYLDYIYNSVCQFLPESDMSHLDSISKILMTYDIVVLQEVDAGSLRSGFINQIEYLASIAGFSYVHRQLNRNVGPIGQFCNALLSKYKPLEVENHKLPGLKGRGAILARFELGHGSLVLVGLHLALGERTRLRQLEYVLSLIEQEQTVILMGDLNCSEKGVRNTALTRSNLYHVNSGMSTFPSWAPKRCIDHIWISSRISVEAVEVLSTQLSDHRPISMEFRLS